MGQLCREKKHVYGIKVQDVQSDLDRILLAGCRFILATSLQNFRPQGTVTLKRHFEPLGLDRISH